MKQNQTNEELRGNLPQIVRNSGGLTLMQVRVKPSSARNSISVEAETKSLLVKVKSPPIEGRANKALLEFLAEISGLPKSSFSLRIGGKSRLKLVELRSCGAEDFIARILPLLSGKNRSNSR